MNDVFGYNMYDNVTFAFAVILMMFMAGAILGVIRQVTFRALKNSKYKM